ncbi:hypothetical protein DKX38_024159 [Salix brachista]|uniref:Uncharacterized protein n=1 Tax=Salix brachista TaxID=2182728 RepID=A0A5N5JQY8_9ROSI|nr:hypothetical protein DKX38_024159 [Salix brachista]
MSIAWVPGGDGAFVVAHADGNLYVYEKSKDGAGDSSFPVIKDQTHFSVSHARYSKVEEFVFLELNFHCCIVPTVAWKAVASLDTDFFVHSSFPIFKSPIQRLSSCSSDRLGFSFINHDFYTYPTKYAVLSLTPTNCMQSNPIARWHICQGSINGIAFSNEGAYLATVGRDGYLRVFDYSKEQLICGGISYYGALLCCAWSKDAKYILTGGEDDLVQVWSMEDRKVVAWGEGHNSWVSGVAFDSYWSSPNSEGTGENVVYRFGSVGQDTQLLLWDLEMDEIVVPLRRCPPGGSPTFSTGSQSSHWDSVIPVGTLQPAPSMCDVPKLSPVVAHRVHMEPLSGLVFTQESVITVCREGHVKIWMRPGASESQPSNSETISSTSLKEKPLLSSKIGSSTYKQ